MSENTDVTPVRNVERLNLDESMETQHLGIITAEILVKPGNLASGDTNGFTNIVTWANHRRKAEQKVLEVLKSYGWEVLGIEAVVSLSTKVGIT